MSGRGGKKRQKAVSKSARAGVLFPVSRMNRYLRRLSYRLRISAAAPVYQAAVIEYLTGMFTRKILIADDNSTEGNAAFHSSRELVFTRSRDPGNHEFTTCQWNAF